MTSLFLSDCVGRRDGWGINKCLAKLYRTSPLELWLCYVLKCICWKHIPRKRNKVGHLHCICSHALLLWIHSEIFSFFLKLLRYQRPPLVTGKADVSDEVGHVSYVEFKEPRNTFWQTLTPTLQVIQSIWSLMFNQVWKRVAKGEPGDRHCSAKHSWTS